MRVLVLNAGSSSLKASINEVGRRDALASVDVDWGSDATRAADRAGTLQRVIDQLSAHGSDPSRVAAVGHRIVHGGSRLVEPVLLVEAVLAQLDETAGLAPLHNPIGIETARAAARLLADRPQVAVFDTAFHATLPEEGYVYPLPRAWHADWGIRRYGFHGLSVAWATRRAAELLGRPVDDLSLVVAHLGSGCSVTAVKGGRSVSTSMGMTPLEGLMMGTRAGSVDPGVLLRVLRDGRLSVDELAEALDHESGLLGVSGISSDVRELARASAAGNRRAALALAIFVRRAAEGIAAAASALERLDALVFSGGIGENAGELRAEIVARLGVLGVAPVPVGEDGADRLLSAAGAAPAVLRVAAREDIEIAEQVARVLGRA